jgi:hypothetical protein
MPKYFKIEKLLYICIPIIIRLSAGVVELVDLSADRQERKSRVVIDFWRVNKFF